jgi:hypothetical protein
VFVFSIIIVIVLNIVIIITIIIVLWIKLLFFRILGSINRSSELNPESLLSYLYSSTSIIIAIIIIIIIITSITTTTTINVTKLLHKCSFCVL